VVSLPSSDNPLSITLDRKLTSILRDKGSLNSCIAPLSKLTAEEAKMREAALMQRIQQLQGITVAEKNQIVESKENEIKAITESAARKDAMDSLLKPLNKEKSAIMRDLLESVQTSKLKGAFDRYLPAVLDGKSIIKESKVEKEMINENIKEVTGDKQTKKPAAKKPVSKKKQAAAAAGAATTAAAVLAGIEKAKKAKQTTVGATPDKAKDQAAQKRVRPTRPKPPGSQRDKVRPTRPKPPGSQKDNKFLAEPTPKKSQAKKAPAKKPVDPQAQQYRPGRATEEPLRAFGGRYDPKTEVLRNVMRNGKKKTMVFRKKK